MSEYKLKTPKKVEDAVVDVYRKIENGVMGVYQKIESKFVDVFLEKENVPSKGASEERGGKGPEHHG